MAETEAPPLPQPSPAKPNGSSRWPLRQLGVLDLVIIIGSWVGLVGYTYMTTGDMIAARTADLVTKIEVLTERTASRDQSLKKDFLALSEEVTATVAVGMADRNDAILTALMGEIGAEHYYTVIAANVPWKILTSVEWKSIYTPLGEARVWYVGDRGILEIDFVEFDSAKALAIQKLVGLAKGENIKFTIDVKYRTPK